MAPKVAAMDTWWPHATVRIGLAVPGRPIGPWSRRTAAPEASGTRQDRPARHVGNLGTDVAAAALATKLGSNPSREGVRWTPAGA